MLRRVAVVRTDISEEYIASINTVVFLRGLLRLLVTANAVPSSPIPDTLMMEATHSSETPALRRATRRNISEDGILHSRRRENLKP
jgi:hypothetical protein